MAHERLILTTSTGELVIPRTDFLSLEVELDNELASLFRLRLAIRLQPNRRWTYVDDERFQVWKPLTIHAGFETAADELMSGYITHIKPDFQRDPAYCTIEIWGMDRSVLMDREEKLYAWLNEKDSTIAEQIFKRHGFSAKVGDTVDDTYIVHNENVSTIMQRETDMQFLKRLAQRNGFECYVEGTTGFFRAPQLRGTPQPVLAVQFGEGETNVNSFALEVNALAPTRVAMFDVDWRTKTILEASADTGRQRVLGRTNAAGLLAPGIEAGKVYVNMHAATGTPEMATLCQELLHQAEWLVTAEGEIDGNHYAHILKPHGTVTVKGVGEAHSGIYYVTHVTHTFSPRGYTQFFRAKRNALMPSGVENFAGNAPGVNRFL